MKVFLEFHFQVFLLQVLQSYHKIAQKKLTGIKYLCVSKLPTNVCFKTIFCLIENPLSNNP